MTLSSPEPGRSSRPIRVLFMVDSIYWVISNFFHQIQKGNPKLETQVYSYYALRKAMKRFGEFPMHFDIMHILRRNPIKPFKGNYPIVSTFHHMDSTTDVSLLQNSSSVMVVSEEWRKYLLQKGCPPNKLGIVPFAVDTEVFHPPSNEEERRQIRHSLDVPQKAFVIGFAARRTSDEDKRKGIDCFLEALKLANQQVENLATVIIGPGWKHLKTELTNAGISCSLVPYQIDHDSIAKYYRAMDVFWVTAKIEGGPVPLLEAMASEIPCISTPVGAAIELIENGVNGFSVQFDSPEQFVELSKMLKGDNELRRQLGKNARNTILRERTWTQSQEKLVDLYEQTIRNFQKDSISMDSTYQEGFRTGLNPSKFSPRENPEDTPSHIKRWSAVCEHLNGLRMVLEMNEWKAAFQIFLRALKISPFDPKVWVESIKILKKRVTKV